MHRRDFLRTAAVGGLSLTLNPSLLLAQPGPTQVAAAQRFAIGDWTVTALGDGYLNLDVSVLQGIDDADFAEMLRAAFIDGPAVETSVNCYLVDTGDALHMIDAGTGTAFGPNLGALTSNLTAAGYDTANVATLLATHLHPDHVGGVATAEDGLFPNATLHVAEAETAFWQSDDIKSAAPENLQGFFDLARGVIAKFGDRVSSFTGETAIVPGLTAVPLPGHTPGHTGAMIENGGESLLMWADITHVTPVQFARPDVTIGFDADQDLARATRAQLLDQAATDRQLIAGAHLPFPGIGYVERAGDAYRYVSLPFDYL